LNSRPQPYQGCALPLSYGSTFAEERAYDDGALPLSTRLAGREDGRHVIAMSEKEKEREEKLAAALRDNLRKRKAQARTLKSKKDGKAREA
jgi:hypothetical protein